VNDKGGDGDDACSQVARDAFINAVVLQRHINDRQVTDVLQCSRRRRKITKYLHTALNTRGVTSIPRAYLGRGLAPGPLWS